MANRDACELYIEQEIKEGLSQGKTPYSIGKELSAWVEKLFETSIPAETLKSRAARIQKQIGSNEPPPSTTCNLSDKPDNQVPEVKHGGKREGAGAPLKYEKAAPPWSCAMQMAGNAIGQLERIPDDDPKRQDAFQKVMLWIKDNR